MIRTFNEWFYANEKAYDDLTKVTDDTVDHWKLVEKWLRSAFDAGYSAGEFNKEFLILDLKQQIRNLTNER